MTTRVDGYDHHTGRHCGSTSLRNLATHYGWGYDEETCFGLAAGLGFTYFDLPESPHRGFFGRPPRLEVAFFEHLGIDHDHREGDGWNPTLGRIRDRVAADDPVMVFTDIYYLDYFDTDTHFAPHSLLCVGLDDDAGTVSLSDSEFEDRQELPVDRLRAAMTSDHVMALRARHLVVTDPVPSATTADAARAAIETTARYMLDPSSTDRESSFGTQGLDGVRRLAADVPSWIDLPDPRWTVRFAYQNVERRGTGGGTFRRMYADFLETAADVVPDVPAETADRMHDVAADWTAVGETLKAASELDDVAEMDPYLDDASAAIADLADREQRLCEDLLAAVT